MFCITVAKERRNVVLKSINNREFAESLEFQLIRLIFVFIGVTVFSMLASVKMLNLREFDKIDWCFQNYVACLGLNTEGGSSCSKSYCQYLYINLGLIVLYTWPAVITVFLLYLSVYKKVRKLLLCVLTCGKRNAEIRND